MAGCSYAAALGIMPVGRPRDRWAAAAERRQRLDAELSELLSAAASVEAMAAELQRDTAVMRRVSSAKLSCIGPPASRWPIPRVHTWTKMLAECHGWAPQSRWLFRVEDAHDRTLCHGQVAANALKGDVRAKRHTCWACGFCSSCVLAAQ